MPLEYADNPDDPRLAVYRDLKDRELVARQGLFIAEGVHLVRRMLAAGHAAHSLLLAQRRVEVFAPLAPEGVPVYVLPDALIDRVVGFKFHSGVLACGRRPANATIEQVLANVPDAAPVTLAVCPQLLNHENVGAMARVAAAFGAQVLLLGAESCDPYRRRALRVSMGAVFTLPIVRANDLLGDLQRLQSRWHFQLAAAVTHADAEPLAKARRPGRPDRLALLFGPEAHGLDDRYLSICDRRITIPMQPGTDSLNVAVAAAVCLYHFTQAAPSGAG